MAWFFNFKRAGEENQNRQALEVSTTLSVGQMKPVLVWEEGGSEVTWS